MGRTPCCEKMGLKRGPWTSEEDTILINHINENGHDNWRALPKRAGLLRCGKSCRLRWMNYLRPDIKRGNFTREEEDTIVKLHQELGNKWSVIAAKLPGRTDNEIKNIWHTNLKKKLDKKTRSPIIQALIHETKPLDFNQNVNKNSATNSALNSPPHSSIEENSPPRSSSEISSAIGDWPEMDESFWSEVFSGEGESGASDFSTGGSHFPMDSNFDMVESAGIWNDNLFYEAEELIELPEIW